MGTIIDIIAIIILAITVFFGYKRGFIGVAFKLLTFVTALILTAILYIPVSNLIIQNTKIDDYIYQTIVDKFGDGENIEYTKIEYVDNYITEMKNNSVDTVATQISLGISKIATAILLFVCIRILLLLFYKFSELLADLPIIKQFDKAGGIVYGVLEGLIIIVLAVLLAVLISTITNNIEILGLLNKSVVGKIIMNFL